MQHKNGRWVSVCVGMVLTAAASLATDGTWVSTGGGGGTDYGRTNNWADGIVAGGAGATLVSLSSALMEMPVPALGAATNVVLGNLIVPDNAAVSATVTINPGFGAYGHTETLVLDSGVEGVPATIQNNCTTNTSRIKIRSDILLRSDLSISFNSLNELLKPDTAVYLTGNISEDGTPRGLTVSCAVPGNQVSLFGDNLFSGDIDVQQGILRAQAYTRLGGVGRQFGRNNTIIATNAASQVDLGGFSFGTDQSLLLSGCGVNGTGVLVASQQSPCYTSVWSGPITLAGDTAVGMGYIKHYPRKTGSAIALTGAIGDQGAGRTLIKTSFNTLVLAGANTYGGGTILSNGFLSATSRDNLGTGPLTFAGGAFVFQTPWDITSSGIVITNLSGAYVKFRNEQDVTFDGVLGPCGSVYKSGNGTLTLTRTEKTANTIIYGGAVNLDYTTRPEQKLPSVWYVQLYNNGRLNITGGSQPFTNSIHSVPVAVGAAGVISITGAAGTRFNLEGAASVSVGAGSALDLRIQDGTALDLSRANFDGANMLNSRMTYEGRAFVTKVAWNDGTVIPFAAASTAWDHAVWSHMDVTADTPVSVPADAKIRTLRFNDPDAGQLTLQDNMVLTNGAILVTAEMGTNEVCIQGGTLSSVQNNELIVHQYNTQAVLRISSILTNTPAGGNLVLTKTGPGTLVLSDVPNTFSGSIYVLGGTLEIESQQAFGVTNHVVYVYNGSTLRLRGQQVLGTGGATYIFYCNEAGGIIDVPDASDTVKLLGRVGMQAYGRLTKTGQGKLTLTNWTQLQNESFLGIPSWYYVVEGGTLDIGDVVGVGPRWMAGECLCKLTVKNNAVLQGAAFLYGNGATNGGGSSEDDQGMFHMYVDATGAIVDLHGQSVNMGVKGDEVYSSDFISGPGTLTVTNSLATSSTVSFGGAYLNGFTGVFDAAKYYLRNIGGGVPNGEFPVPADAAVDYGWSSFPYTTALGMLSGTGSFGGKCPDNQAQPPLLVGRDADETFEYSGYLWGTYNSIGNSAFPFRYTKVGSNAWRISGTTNAMTGDVTVRNGTILVGADSPGQGAVGALGKASVVLGDHETLAGHAPRLLTDGPYVVGNTLVLGDSDPGATVTLGGNQTAGASLFSGALSLTRDVVLTAANTDENGVTFSGAVSGPGGIAKTGVGTVYLTGTVTHTGPTVVQQGSLVVQGDMTVTNALTVTAGLGGMGTLAVGGNLTLGEGAVLGLSVSGTLDRSQSYTLITWSGTRSGLFTSVTGLSDNWHVGYRSGSVVLYYAMPGTLVGVY